MEASVGSPDGIAIFGINCLWVSVFFQVDAYGGHMGEEGKWGICGDDCPIAVETEGGCSEVSSC